MLIVDTNLFSKRIKKWWQYAEIFPGRVLKVCLPLLGPLDSMVIHFVDKNDQMLDSGRLGQHGMLSRLTPPLKARLKFTLPRRDDLF